MKPASLPASDISNPAALPFRLWTAEEKQASMQAALKDWPPGQDVWIYGYGSLIWRPEFDYLERRLATLRGHHRALCLWSRVNRGTPDCPGLVFALMAGGSCDGLALRVPHDQVEDLMPRLWAREMPNPVYDPKWLRARTPQGVVSALAFTLSRKSPSHTGELPPERYRDIFARSCGRYGTTLDYARLTFDGLKSHGIHDHALEKLLHLADPAT